MAQKKDTVVLSTIADVHSPQQDMVDDPEHSINTAFVPSPLHASKDILYNAINFRFAAGRFRYRGYEANQFKASINGIVINGLYEQQIPWQHWSGLNEMMNNQELSTGSVEQEYAFGGAAFNNYIHLEASSIRRQKQVSLVFSNRNYGKRVGFAFSSGWNSKGVAFAGMLSKRTGNEILYNGHFFESTSYLFSAQKKLRDGFFNLLFSGVHLHRSSNSALTQEYRQLAGGRRANNNTAAGIFTHQPYLIASGKHQLSDDIQLNISTMITWGKQYQTGIDWYAAPDPLPDYYRYLPSYQADSILQLQVQQQWHENPTLGELNWQRLYSVNANSRFQLPGVAGDKSMYILERRVKDVVRTDFSFRLNQQLTTTDEWVLMVYHQHEQVRLYKELADLLGGDYYTDWNQFGEDNIPDATGKQNDLNNPDRILNPGDLFGYHYAFRLSQWTAFAQWATKRRKYDCFFGMRLQQTSYERVGHMRNGVFSYNSFGSSGKQLFLTPAFKTGFIWKRNGRSYLQVHALYQQEAPQIQDYFIAPRVNNLIHPASTIAHFFQTELAWLYNSPTYKIRAQAFLASRMQGSNIQSFYHDGYRNLVSYVLSDINTSYAGVEGAIGYTITPKITAELVLVLAKQVYRKPQLYQLFIDNQIAAGEKDLVYVSGFHVPGTPQQAANLNMNIKPRSNIWMNISASYLRSFWLDFNPLRRTKLAGTDAAVPHRAWIFMQEQLPDIFYVDAFIGSSFYVKNGKRKKFTVQLFLSAANLFNTTFLSGGYEQLRYGVNEQGTNRFPNKYFISQGANFSFTSRFNL